MTDREERNVPRARRQYLVSIDGSLALISVLVVVQMWLLTASLEAYLSGHHDKAIPGAIFSGVLFVAVASLYVFVRRLEKQSRHKRL